MKDLGFDNVQRNMITALRAGPLTLTELFERLMQVKEVLEDDDQNRLLLRGRFIRALDPAIFDKVIDNGATKIRLRSPQA